MNVYSKLAGLAGINGTSFTLIDDSKQQKAIMTTNINGDLNISGQIDDVQLTDNFVIDKLINVSINPFDSVNITSSNTSIVSKNLFTVANEYGDNILKIDNSPVNGGTNSDVEINADKLNVKANGEFYVDDVKIVNVKQIPQLVVFKNPHLTQTNGTAAWTESMPTGVHFEEYPMMQIIDMADGHLRLCDISFNLDNQTVTVYMDKLTNDVTVNKYKLMLFGYQHSDEIKNG